MKVLALLCTVVTTASAVTKEQDVALQRANEVVEWIRANGGFFNGKQEFRREVPGDSSSALGIFATEDIKEGDVITKIPWNSVITAGTDSKSSEMKCDSTRVLIEQMRKRDEASPYVRYLLESPPANLPSAWSEEGKDLLDLIVGYNMLPPKDFFGWGWTIDCDGSDDPLEQNAAFHFLSRADDDILFPLYDLYNHRNGAWYNTRHHLVRKKALTLFASRDIKAGEQVYNSYNQCENCRGRSKTYGTPEILRDYGFVEPYPQRWTFHDQKIAFDIDKAEDGDLEVTWLKKKEPSEKDIQFLIAQLRRLREVVEPVVRRAESDMTVPQNELDSIRHYQDALITAITKALESKDIDVDDDSVRALGTKDFAKGIYNALTSMGKKDRHTFTCKNKKIMKFKDYKWIEATSNYQSVTFMHREEDNDMCLDLDNIVQICTSYRPQYHEYVTHFAARYKDTIKRAVFVGGGDSMVLHELLKYPDIEKVVGLELDQTIVRGSFKYFHTQPHFDDDRVEWWFGDATKSLLMLPKEYFVSFDLVVVDLSETVMSLSVTKDLDILEALALLLKPDGIFVKNEWYLDKLSEIFDYTAELYATDNPVICDQSVAIGSNSIDFLSPNMDNLVKAHGVETLILDPVKDSNDRFKLINGYRKNDARAQGKCNVTTGDSDLDGRTAGILMIVEAENTSLPLGWETLEGALVLNLQKEGLESLTTVVNPSDNGGTVAVILLKEGQVTVRTWPDKNYCAFDIQLWAAFNKMENIKNALATAVGSSSESLSSYRIVVGGMLGTKTRRDDQDSIGPRITQNRDCEEKSIRAAKNASIDQGTIDIVLEESLKLVQRRDIVVAVLCGDSTEKCKSTDALAENSNVSVVVPLTSCQSLMHAGNEEDMDMTQMFACETEWLNVLRDTVSRTEMLSAVIIDTSASYAAVKILDRIWRNGRNQERLLLPHSIFVAPMPDQTEAWRRNFLGQLRKNIKYPELHRAEVTFESTSERIEVGILSTGDSDFYTHLVDKANTLESRTGLQVDIRNIQGGPEKFQDDFNEKRFAWDDYDPSPAKEQFVSQQPLGEQLVLQLEVKKGKKLPGKLEKAIGLAFKEADFSNSEFHVFEELGDGAVYVAASSEGTAVIVWDGRARVDINLFAFESHSITSFVDEFLQSLEKAKAKPKVLLRDVQPRGIGRVINFIDDLQLNERSGKKSGRVVKLNEPSDRKSGRVVKL